MAHMDTDIIIQLRSIKFIKVQCSSGMKSANAHWYNSKRFLEIDRFQLTFSDFTVRDSCFVSQKFANQPGRSWTKTRTFTMTLGMGTRASKIQDDEDVDVQRSPDSYPLARQTSLQRHDTKTLVYKTLSNGFSYHFSGCLLKCQWVCPSQKSRITSHHPNSMTKMIKIFQTRKINILESTKIRWELRIKKAKTDQRKVLSSTLTIKCQS